jgi:outer membrane protein TolC
MRIKRSQNVNEIHVLKESVLPGAEKAVEAIRQGYEAGRFSYLDVNEASEH